MESPVTADFVSSFQSKAAFLRDGRGIVIVRNGEIVSGASSYTRYREGIEIEVDTVEEVSEKETRNKHEVMLNGSTCLFFCKCQCETAACERRKEQMQWLLILRKNTKSSIFRKTRRPS
ncbi:MAG: GNAT family N-acetyltransferase [Oscillospiraceae bacterium]|nr:GNAT family N-acetyltransferase [Oscillospiraceae bacterium]